MVSLTEVKSNRSSTSDLPHFLTRLVSGSYIHNLDINSEYLECQNVRISPSPLLFDNAFEGKSYNQKFTIQNLGKTTAFVRICPPSSYAFRVKPLIRGQKLCPGLVITRNVTYTYMRATAVPLASIPIYVNDEHMDYKLIVLLSGVEIFAVPHQIDFGKIDAGQCGAVRMLSLHNTGSKGTRFAIDLGRNEIELIVEPSKGLLQPCDTMTLRVECLGKKLGSFVREFWIKCETPLRISVTGTIIAPELHSVYINRTEDFTMIDFPKTYYGTSYIKTMVIRNLSSTPAVYCTLAEFPDKWVALQEARELRPDYADFSVTPLEGVFHPQEGRIFHFTYTPQKNGTKNKKGGPIDKFSFCSIQIVRVSCMVLNQIVIPETVEMRNDSVSRYSSAADDTVSALSVPMSFDDDESVVDVLPESFSIPSQKEEVFLRNNVRVILYGEAETAGITITPNSLNILDILNNTTVTRELLLRNNSSSLPIIFSYKKVSYVNIEPKIDVLPPSGMLEICVTISPTKLGKVKTKIAFDLLYCNQPREDDDYVLVGYTEIPLKFEVHAITKSLEPRFNMGITPDYIKEVGMFTDDIRFNTRVPMPRATLMEDIKLLCSDKDDDLIAFPNDRPKSTRPWKSLIRCRTICANIPRFVNTDRDLTYQLTKSRSSLKHKDNTYFQNYLRQEEHHLKRLRHVSNTILPDYEISTKGGLLATDFPKPKCVNEKEDQNKIPAFFIPLTPLQLHKIKVHPSDIKLNKMAPRTTSTAKVMIVNQNEFSIRINAKPRKPVVTFPEGERKIIKPFAKMEIPLTYNSSGMLGRYNVIVDFLVNGSNTFAVSITGDVVPKCVKFPNEEIIFEPDECSGKYVDIINPVNVPIKFSWTVPDSCFTVEPLSGSIPARRHITCCVSYVPHHTVASTVEAALQSENGRNQMISILADIEDPKVKLKHPKVEFNEIPLNLPTRGTAVLQNLGKVPVTFTILKPQPMHGLSITPIAGIINSFGEQIFDIRLQIPACIEFTCTVEIEVQKVKVIKLEVVGTVIFPQIVLKPDSLHLQKIVSNAFSRQVFVIINKTAVTAIVEFPLHDYTEYTILDERNFSSESVPITKIELQAYEQKQLYLHFNPVGAALYRFFLPMIINGILGPAQSNVLDTQRPDYYTQINERRYTNGSSKRTATILKMPKILPTLVIYSVVSGDTIRFSKLHLNFKYFPDPNFYTETDLELKIWNGSKDTCKFCIRTDNLHAPFSLTYLAGNEITNLEYSMTCVLAPKEDVTLKASFNPCIPGNYYIQLPIYVRKYLDGNLFNNLTFTGWYPYPTISAADDVYFEPVPLKCETEYCLYLRMKYHPRSCTVLASASTLDLKISIDKPTHAKGKFAKEARVILKYSTNTRNAFKTSVKFYCACGAECLVDIVVAADNDTLTTHAFMRSYVQTLMSPQAQVASTKSTKEVIPVTQNISITDHVDTWTLSTSNISIEDAIELPTNYNSTSFPIFPDDDDQTEYAQHMRETIKVMEEWLFHQGFYGKCHFKIPEGIAMSPENTRNPTKEKKTKKVAVLKFVELLINLIGKETSNYIPIRDIPHDNVERINYIYNVYSKSKDFIVKQGGLLSHVFPEHLLTYTDYVLFMKNIREFLKEFIGEPAPAILDEKKFYLTSKQSWLDFLLQTYKVFILSHVRYPSDLIDDISDSTVSIRLKNNSHPSLSVSCNISVGERVTPASKAHSVIKSFSENGQIINANSVQESRNSLLKKESCVSFNVVEDTAFWHYFLRAEKRNINIYSEPETILLLWLDYNFNKQRNVLWGHCKIIPLAKKIMFFDYDLSDGLVLAAVTSAYCPYLRTFLQDVYPDPTCIEKASHNVSKVLQSWRKINLSFNLTPKQVINPNNVQMLMLVDYLYEVLPAFYPNNLIRFRAGLSTICEKQMDIQNLSASAITYKVIFFGNEKGFFSVLNNTISLQPRGKAKLFVNFNAKKLCLEQVTMVLSGETFGRCYAKAMAFSLVGESIPSYCTSTVTIPSPLYDVLELEIPIQSPYPGPAIYDINFSVNEPNDVTTCKILPWKVVKKSKIPKRMVTTQTSVEVDENGVGTLDLIIGCITTNEKPTWLVCTHPELGAFTLKVVTTPQFSNKMYTTIAVVLPNNFGKIKCHCKTGSKSIVNTHCPRTISIEIPCRNDFLWNAVSKVMMKIVDDQDLEFWRKYLGTTAGIQINKWMTEQEAKNEAYYDIQYIFESTVNYTITLQSPQNQGISLPPTTTVENVHSLGHHVIPAHIEQSIKYPSDFQIELKSVNGLELRNYSVHFLTEKQSDNDMRPSECKIIDIQ